MFDATTQGGSPLTVQVPFWQCVKAGVGFTIGAAITSIIGMSIFYVVLLPAGLRLLELSARR